MNCLPDQVPFIPAEVIPISVGGIGIRNMGLMAANVENRNAGEELASTARPWLAACIDSRAKQTVETDRTVRPMVLMSFWALRGAEGSGLRIYECPCYCNRGLPDGISRHPQGDGVRRLSCCSLYGEDR